ncbi:hypothetical protein SETIT_2G012200v2 [Setaria italica]|uniref:F-box domain-containing protein n=1 Tax=Setaria italica TaxID=4555 RepID=A0A368PTY0_SETIT|nr:hypothetical protein SETIT_2G012200v2 [Setaria italica]
MVMATRAKKRRLEEEEKQELVDDFISGLPDAILGDIVTLLPTRDGTRTQVLSSRWHHVWRSAPLNLDSNADSPRTIRGNIRDSEISRALSAHQGPGRRFLHEFPYIDTVLHRLHLPADAARPLAVLLLAAALFPTTTRSPGCTLLPTALLLAACTAQPHSFRPLHALPTFALLSQPALLCCPRRLPGLHPRMTTTHRESVGSQGAPRG